MYRYGAGADISM
jgi:hypothetical protein